MNSEQTMNITCPWINSTTNYKLPDGLLQSVLLFYVGGCLLAVLGNIVVLITIYRRMTLHRVSYYLVAALAFEDLLQGIIIGSMNLHANLEGCWQLGRQTCFLFGYATTFLGCTELLLLAAITVDRYIACCKPLQYHVLFTIRRCKYVIAACWIYPALLAILPLIGWSSYRYVPHLQVCQVEWSRRPLSVGYVCLMALTTFVPCSLMIVFCQVRIYGQVKKITDQPMPQTVRSGISSAIVMTSSRPIKATRTVTLVTWIYFLSWTPYVAVRFTKPLVEGEYSGTGVLCDLERASLYIFAVSKFANPIIYGIYNREFRHECIKLLRR